MLEDILLDSGQTTLRRYRTHCTNSDYRCSRFIMMFLMAHHQPRYYLTILLRHIFRKQLSALKLGGCELYARPRHTKNCKNVPHALQHSLVKGWIGGMAL